MKVSDYNLHIKQDDTIEIPSRLDKSMRSYKVIVADAYFTFLRSPSGEMTHVFTRDVVDGIADGRFIREAC